MASSIAELRTQLIKAQKEIDHSIAILRDMEDSRVIVPPGSSLCAPIIVDPPRPDVRCELEGGPITVQQTEAGFTLLSKWMHNMILVLGETDSV